MDTLEELIKGMGKTLETRRKAVAETLDGGRPSGSVGPLREVLSAIETLPGEEDGRRRLRLADLGERALDLSYEVTELRRDVRYLEDGEESLAADLFDSHPAFAERVREGCEFLSGVRLKNLFTDRDGTVNNYCARYNTSVQSAYNAVFLGRFARTRVENGVILTSAPLAGVGILDMSAMPDGLVIHGGSKGREMADTGGRRHRLEIPENQAEALRTLNRRLKRLLERPDYRQFALLGSGLQFKYGQTTVARQDVNDSVDTSVSRSFLDKVRELVREVDPESRHFRIEDTGKDIEIMLTVDGEKGEKRRDFNKGDGIRFIDRTLGLGMARGPNLVCGDTASDVPMVQASVDLCEETRTIFVTTSEDLRKEVGRACPRSFFVETPDMLVMILNRLGKGEKR